MKLEDIPRVPQRTFKRVEVTWKHPHTAHREKYMFYMTPQSIDRSRGIQIVFYSAVGYYGKSGNPGFIGHTETFFVKDIEKITLLKER